ncbi:disulfide bond formation protein B [Xenorhabdus bovienii]|uniref:Inner membrane protein n=6 Tax=Xenorhabdus bovienii TaxID=40576 RepID=A0A077PH41_XENBV|nr:disulfide bond formation protein B [Xenorhabdus bovienii]MCG3470535.1 disulfide bond formation protein B [Xenorhabdus bovienii]MDE1475841.1 disulfide bond formation protein B [Xenorhabdus bovienii]MDE1479751.1 disulfide bond formation protein B [Xenorhabdus bovienii]MDE1483805.1 disulfide bond formation protein B [Xenorhabdus bovienii]MDE1488263.1 disulfide bond formation protein B [Xenorhabdus bovienii]
MNNTMSASRSLNPAMVLNILGLFGISVVLIIAFYYQLARFELPCPLCLLQRAGIIMIGLGFLFNIYFGIKNAHYSLSLLGCLVTGFIAMRQVSLHILPGDTGYGSTFLGLHFYTWAAVLSILTIIAIAVIMPLKAGNTDSSRYTPPTLGKIAMGLFAFLIAANLVSTVLECGSGQCDDNPTFYQLLKK